MGLGKTISAIVYVLHSTEEDVISARNQPVADTPMPDTLGTTTLPAGDVHPNPVPAPTPPPHVPPRNRHHSIQR